MGNIGEELKKSLNKLGITRQVEAVGVVEQAREEIAKYIPAEDFEVISFKNGTLKIATKSSVVANEIQARISKIKKNTLIKRINIKLF